MKKVLIIDGGIILAAFVLGACIYHLMPATMPVHWGTNWRPDRYAGRFVGVFGLPIVMVIVVALMIILPWIDPDDVKLPKHYNLLLVVIPLFLLTFYVSIILWTLGIKVKVIVPTAEAVLWYFVGYVLQDSKRNRWIGLKIRWTMSSDSVWEKTHRTTGLLFKLSAAVIFAGNFLSAYQAYLSTIPIIITPLYAIIYSYFVYRSEQSEGM